MFKKVLCVIWTFSLEKAWNWLRSKTEVDEKAIQVVDEIIVRSTLVKAELEDVVDAVKGFKTKSKKKYYKPKAKVDLKK